VHPDCGPLHRSNARRHVLPTAGPPVVMGLCSGTITAGAPPFDQPNTPGLTSRPGRTLRLGNHPRPRPPGHRPISRRKPTGVPHVRQRPYLIAFSSNSSSPWSKSTAQRPQRDEQPLGRNVLTVLAFGSASRSGNTIFGFDPTTSRTVASVVKNASLVASFLNTRVVRIHHARVLLAQ